LAPEKAFLAVFEGRDFAKLEGFVPCANLSGGGDSQHQAKAGQPTSEQPK
jgi:hypothetical protein